MAGKEGAAQVRRAGVRFGGHALNENARPWGAGRDIVILYFSRV
jgi:hypothetical protein